MRPLPFLFCLALCALGGTLVGAFAGDADSGLTTGLAAGAAIASVFILLGGKTT